MALPTKDAAKTEGSAENVNHGAEIDLKSVKCQQVFLENEPQLTVIIHHPIIPSPTPMREVYTSRAGFVYVLVNKHIPGMVKIGATRKHPVERARELSAGTGVPSDYELSYYRDFKDCFNAETILHNRFASVRVNNSREFFSITVEVAIRAVDDAASAQQRLPGVESEGIVGGTQRAVTYTEVATHWAELFASFDPSDSNELTADEQAQCQVLRRHLARQRQGSP